MKIHATCFYLLIIVFLFLSGCKDDPVSRENSSQEFEELLTELESVYHPLQNPNPDSPATDLSVLNDIGEAKVIGLGEATHGTKEFFQMKHKIFRYLVENHNVRVFAFEADMGESIFIDRYIQGGQGDIDEIMKTRMHFWTWRNEEVKNLLQWMRVYNEEKTESEKIHYIGVDTQYMTYQPQLIKNFIEQTEPSLLDETRDVLKEIRDLGNGSPSALNESYKKMTFGEFEAITDTLQYLIDRMEELKPEIITLSSDFEFRTHLQLVRNLQQVHQHKYSQENQQGSLRDKFMAENTFWIPTLFGEDTKTAVWAHNLHIIKNRERTGQYLRGALGDDYKTIGFSFGTGSFLARGFNPSTEEISGLELQTITSKPRSNSVNSLFFEADAEKFILNLEDLASNSKLGEYLLMENDFISLGSVYNNKPSDYYFPLSLKSEFDAIIHFSRSNPSTYLN